MRHCARGGGNTHRRVSPRLAGGLGETDQPLLVEAVRNSIYDSLDVIRVYTRKPGKPADHEAPYTLRSGGTVDALAEQVHRDIAASLKYARIRGCGVHDGATVGRDHILADKDVLELHV